MANTKTSDLVSASALTGTEIFYVDDGVNDVKVTALQIKNYAFTVPILAGANVAISTTDIKVGNSTVNLFANSLLVKIQNVTSGANLQSTSLQMGANVSLTTTTLNVGNVTANLVANAILVKVANSIGTANLQPTQLVIGTSTVNSSAFQAGANVFLSVTTLSVGNTTANLLANSVVVKVASASGSANLKSTVLELADNVSLSTTTLSVGNSTANLLANSILVKVANSTGVANLQPGSLIVGNSTVYTTLSPASRSVTGSNTFSLGTSAVTANGYTYLFNGILMQWGWVDANTTVGNITFPVAFPTSIFSYQATANSAAAGGAYIIQANTTTMNVRTAVAVAATNTWWLAIGN